MDAVLCGTSTASGTSRTAAGMPTFPLEEQCNCGNSGQQQNKEKKICQIHFISPYIPRINLPTWKITRGNQISHGSLEQCGAKSTLHRTEFSPGSSKCCNTGHVQHCEYQERESSQCRREYHVQHGGKFSVSGSTGQNGKGADNGFFCCNSSNQCGGCTPICKAKWSKDRGNEFANGSEHAGSIISYQVKRPVKTLQKPDNHGSEKNDGKCFADKVFRFFPHVEQNTFGRWDL